MFSLPLCVDAVKNRSAKKNAAAFAIACVFVAVYGYNRIHMAKHFLTDVCFGILITYLIYAAISAVFLRAAEKRQLNRDGLIYDQNKEGRKSL